MPVSALRRLAPKIDVVQQERATLCCVFKVPVHDVPVPPNGKHLAAGVRRVARVRRRSDSARFLMARPVISQLPLLLRKVVMLTSHTRLIAATLAGSLSLAACGGGGSPSSMTPLTQSTQRVPETVNDGHCKMLPLIDIRTRLQEARSGQSPGPLSCGVRASHGSASRPNTGSIQVFDVPGSIKPSKCTPYELFNVCGTFGYAINAEGTIIGIYLKSNGVETAFIRTAAGNYTSFQAPNGQGTSPFQITNDGAIVGQYADANNVSHAFVRRKGGSFLTYDAPWASQIPDDTVPQGTGAGAINAGGDTAGLYWDAQGLSHGFIRYNNGSFVQVIPNGSETSSVCLVCLNDSGTAAGDYTGSDGIGRGFIRSASGAIRTIAKPGAVDTGLTGINNRNIALGFFVDANSVVWGLIRGHNKRTVFQDPEASETYGNGTQPEAINNAGAVTGLYADAQSVAHGFYRSPTGQFSEFDPPGSVYTEPVAINANGTVTGYWYDAQGANHGFIWTPQ